LVTPLQLRQNRRYSLLIIAVVAMLLPGTDPVTMLLSMAPLLVLYEASIWLSVLFNRGREQTDVLSRWRGEWGEDEEDEDADEWAGVDEEEYFEDEDGDRGDDDEERSGEEPGVTRP